MHAAMERRARDAAAGTPDPSPKPRARAGHVASFACAALLLLASAPDAAAAEACMAYEPATVTLRGTLDRRTYAGAPNYKGVALGDAPETALYLVLADGICTADARPDRVVLVQLELEGALYASLRPRVGTAVTLRGKLLAAQNRHHHAPILMRDVTVLR